MWCKSCHSWTWKISYFFHRIVPVKEGQKATWASHLWPPGDNSFFFTISPFGDCNGLSSGQAGERGTVGRVSFLSSWYCKSPEQRATVTCSQPTSFCPHARSDSTSFHWITSHWRSNSAQMRDTRRKHFIYGQCSPYPTILLSAIKSRARLWEDKLLPGDISCPCYHNSDSSNLSRVDLWDTPSFSLISH